MVRNKPPALNFNLELETPTGNVKPNAPATAFGRDPLLRAAVVAPGFHVSPQRACNGSLPPLPPLPQVTPPQTPTETTRDGRPCDCRRALSY